MPFLMFYQDNFGDKSVTWHVSSKKPDIPFMRIGRCVHTLQADGEELGYIMLRFRDLPITHGGSCTWRGEMAQFIYDNL